MPGQGFELDSVGDRELWQVYNQGSDLFALSGVPGVPGHHTHPQTCTGSVASLPHSSSQEWALGVLMSSLLIPLSGESDGGGRAGSGLLLLGLSCCHLTSSRSSPGPGRSSPNLFYPGPRPSPPRPTLCCLPSSPTSISMGVIGTTPSGTSLPSVSPYSLSRWVPLHLCLVLGMGSAACALIGQAVCLFLWHPYR